MTARRPRIWERAWRWCRRYPAVVALGTLVLVTLLAGLAAFAWLWHRAEGQRQRAEANFAKAREAVNRCFALVTADPALQEPGMEEARKATARFIDIFGRENFFVEIQDHGIPEQRKIIPGLLKLGEEFKLKVICTNDVHYINKRDSHAHDCLICIGTQTHLEDTKRMKYQPEQFFLRSAAEMKALFNETPEAVKNTLEVAEKCNLEIKFGELHYPVFHPPEHFTREGLLRKQLAEGLHKRYTIHARAEGKEFVVEGIDDPKRLPTFQTMVAELARCKDLRKKWQKKLLKRHVKLVFLNLREIY